MTKDAGSISTHLEAISLKEAFSSCLSRKGSRQELWTAWMHSAMLAASLKPSVALPVPLVLASGCCWSVSTAGDALIGSKPARMHWQITDSSLRCLPAIDQALDGPCHKWRPRMRLAMECGMLGHSHVSLLDTYTPVSHQLSYVLWKVLGTLVKKT